MNPVILLVAFAAVAMADIKADYGVKTYEKKEYGHEGYGAEKSYGYEKKSYGGKSQGYGYDNGAYHGKYGGKCGADGFYYNDANSFVVCSNGNGYVQACAPGSRNSGHGNYQYGHNYAYTDFCDVNLVDYGYGVNHGYGYGGNGGYGYGGYGGHGYGDGYYGKSGYGYGRQGYGGPRGYGGGYRGGYYNGY